MKKKTYIAAAVLMAVMLAACGKNGGDSEDEQTVNIEETDNSEDKAKEDKSDADKKDAEQDKEENREASQESENETDTDAQTDAAAETGEEVKKAPGKLLEKFIMGKMTATVEAKMSEATDSGYVPVETADIDRLYKVLALDETYTPQEVSYGPLDVTNAAGDWFCLSIVFTGEGEYDSPQTIYVIICETDTDVIVKGSLEDYYRVSASVFSNGQATWGGSGGAGTFSLNSYGVDSKGNFRVFYEETGCYCGWDFYESKGEDDYTSDLPVNKLMGKYGEQATDRMYDSLCMMQSKIGDKYYYWPSTDGYEKADQLLEELAKEMNIEFSTEEEVNRLEEEAFRTEGVDYKQNGEYVKMVFTIKYK